MISVWLLFRALWRWKPWRVAEDVSDKAPRERTLKSVSFQESVSFISDGPTVMEQESQQIQHGCHSSKAAQTPDSEVVQEICYLDQVLDAASANGNPSPTEHIKPISINGAAPSVCVSACFPTNHQSVVVEGQRQSTFIHQGESAVRTNGHVQDDEPGRNAAKFELRAFHEEKRPAKLFTPGEEQQVRVTRRRPSEEVQELERERQELIKDQAVKKNPGIAQRWWNPPQEVPLEDQLDGEKLESLKKYQERKQKKQIHPYPFTQHQMSEAPTMVTFDPDITKKEDIVEEQIDFSSARKQFLQAEATKKDVTPQLYSAKPFSKPVAKSSLGICEVVAETGETHVTWSDVGLPADFTCARAVMTILPEEDSKGPFHSSFHPEESDSGLDELSVRSQDTTLFSLDNVSDSGASLPPTPLPLTPVSPPTPQPTTPVNGWIGGSPTEEELEYHAGVLVQNAIQSALATQNGRDLDSPQLSSPVSPSSACTSSPVPVSSSPVSSGGALSFQSPVSSSPALSNPSPSPDRVTSLEKPSQLPQLQTPSPPASQPVSPPQRPRNGGPRIKIQSSYTRALASSAPTPPPAPTTLAPVPRPAPVYRPPSPPSPEKPEFSYFSKYSEAAELRSTAAAARGPEVEAASGPFRLRSRKQQTLSMIEEEIRAAQQREEELKKQREMQPAVIIRPSSHGQVRAGVRPTISPADRMKSNSLPAKLTLTTRTAPGKIEKVRPAPPVSPSPSEGALSDAGSEDSGGSRPKNFMQTMLEDYETHKIKRKEKMEDNSVLEATRMTRRKSNMALKWEAGIYANEEGEEEEEEEEQEDQDEDMDSDDRVVEYKERGGDSRTVGAGLCSRAERSPSPWSESDEMDYDLELKMISTPSPKKTKKMTMYADELETQLKTIRNRIGASGSQSRTKSSSPAKVTDVRQLLEEKRQGASQHRERPPVASSGKTDVRQRLGKRRYSPDERSSPSPLSPKDTPPVREPVSDVHRRLGVANQDSRSVYSKPVRDRKTSTFSSEVSSPEFTWF
uniref:A-kinase anchor protein 2 n=1 Tax=Nothobranchius pienaari TaxID=704102 RepID=A0A1A8MDL9_9TELE